MQIFISTIATILCLLCVIAIHELGHAWSAKYFKVKLKKISLGFGKIIFRFKSRAGYEVDVGMLPIGGCVHFLNDRVSPVLAKEYKFCFDKKAIWIRTIILLSGSMANIFMAFLALVFMLMLGFKQQPAIIESIKPGTNAAIAGLSATEKIVKVAGQNTPYWRDVGMQFIMHIGQKDVPLTACSQFGVCHDTTLDLVIWNNKQKNFAMFAVIGITPQIDEQHALLVSGIPFFEALKNAFVELTTLSCFFFVMIKQIITGAIPFAALLGPFQFFEAFIDSFSQGFAIFLYFISNFSLAMGIANLLPIPGLDGGAILYGVIEKIRGKPISIALELLIYRLIFIVFAIFLVQLIVNDLRYYF